MWQYLVEEVKQENVQAKLEAAGNHGWELVSSYVICRIPELRVCLIFKRLTP